MIKAHGILGWSDFSLTDFDTREGGSSFREESKFGVIWKMNTSEE